MNTESAVIYARVSDRKQVEKDISIPAQIEKGHDKATSEGWEVVKVFKDEGVSGSSLSGRIGFEAAMEYCEIFNVKHFIIWSSSRFARNRLDALLYKKRLDDNGTQIHYLTFTVDRETDAGRLMDGFLELMDEHKSIQTSRDTRRSMVRNAQQGYWNGGRVPLGFELVPADDNLKKKKLIINKDESWIIEKIFLYKSKQGLGARAISDSLNQQGLKHRGRRWTKSTVHSILKNEIYIGQRVFGKTQRGSKKILPRDQWIIVQSHESVISETLWNDVQEKLDRDNLSNKISKKMPSNTKLIFAGLIYCDKCNSPLYVEKATGRSKQYTYYKCAQSNPDQIHKVKRFNADFTDSLLLEILAEHVLNDHNIETVISDLKSSLDDWQDSRNNESKALKAEVKTTEKRLSRLYDLLETTDKEYLELSDIGPRIRELQNRKNQLIHEINTVESMAKRSFDPSVIEYDEIRELMKNSLFDKTNRETGPLRELILGFVESVSVDPEGLARIEYKPQNLFTAMSKVVHSQEIWLPDTDLLRTVVIEGNILKKA